jgi:hypothetical protein
MKGSMKPHLESQIDDLYKLPLDQFTNARNTLARSLSGNEKKDVTALVKPSLPMWVVNQLYWHNAPTYKALIDASEKSRSAHRAALTGRTVDTHKADELHKATLEKAFTQAVAATEKKGIRLTDATRDAVRRTLAALPTEEPPGRITREPPAVGFSLLTGVTPNRDLTRSSRTGVRPQAAPSAAELKRQKLAEKQAERIRVAAERRAREADEKAKREAEEKAKKDREKREREIEKAEQALREAERRLAELKR